jgi:cyclophilin family peptidyl-prolyl cis-trans isomerase
LRTLLLALTVSLCVALAGCGGDDDELRPPESNPPAAETTPSETTPAEPQRTAGGCEAVEPPQTREPGKQPKPTEPLDASKEWSLVVKTNCGDFTVALDLETGPKNAASLVSLAEAGYFDGTVFHRIVPDFVIQGGDPTASGMGGPGYKVVDPPPQDARYTKGVVAMAKAGPEAAGTGGSQFYVVTADDSGLPPDYAIVGKVSEGLDVVEKIGALGGPTEQPTEPVVIETVEVQSS